MSAFPGSPRLLKGAFALCLRESQKSEQRCQNALCSVVNARRTRRRAQGDSN
jgi:hypothetical protein